MGTEKSDPFVGIFDHIDPGDDYGGCSFAVGAMDSLSERIGPEAAREHERVHSLTYATRQGAARRLSGRVSLRGVS